MVCCFLPCLRDPVDSVGAQPVCIPVCSGDGHAWGCMVVFVVCFRHFQFSGVGELMAFNLYCPPHALCVGVLI